MVIMPITVYLLWRNYKRIINSANKVQWIRTLSNKVTNLRVS